jgi:3-dehydroquinate dehydratase
MTIVMIEGPDATGDRPGHSTVQAALAERAANAGQELLHIRCDDETQLLDRLSSIDRGQADIILLDPGRDAAADPRLQKALGGLDVPYIEVHDDSHERPEPVLPAGAGPRVAVVNGYAAQSYTLAMSVALETLGCADCENEFNVGT